MSMSLISGTDLTLQESSFLLKPNPITASPQALWACGGHSCFAIITFWGLSLLKAVYSAVGLARCTVFISISSSSVLAWPVRPPWWLLPLFLFFADHPDNFSRLP